MKLSLTDSCLSVYLLGLALPLLYHPFSPPPFSRTLHPLLPGAGSAGSPPSALTPLSPAAAALLPVSRPPTLSPAQTFPSQPVSNVVAPRSNKSSSPPFSPSLNTSETETQSPPALRPCSRTVSTPPPTPACRAAPTDGQLTAHQLQPFASFSGDPRAGAGGRGDVGISPKTVSLVPGPKNCS